MWYIVLAAILFLLCSIIEETRLAILCVILGAVFFVIGIVTFWVNPAETEESSRPVPIEYPASEYRLQLRIVEFEGQRDTTYVLVKKINE